MFITRRCAVIAALSNTHQAIKDIPGNLRCCHDNGSSSLPPPPTQRAPEKDVNTSTSSVLRYSCLRVSAGSPQPRQVIRSHQSPQRFHTKANVASAALWPRPLFTTGNTAPPPAPPQQQKLTLRCPSEPPPVRVSVRGVASSRGGSVMMGWGRVSDRFQILISCLL